MRGGPEFYDTGGQPHFLQLLRKKHPPAHPNTVLPPFTRHDDMSTVSPLVVRKAISLLCLELQ
jgi:hypothetical protein